MALQSRDVVLDEASSGSSATSLPHVPKDDFLLSACRSGQGEHRREARADSSCEDVAQNACDNATSAEWA